MIVCSIIQTQWINTGKVGKYQIEARKVDHLNKEVGITDIKTVFKDLFFKKAPHPDGFIGAFCQMFKEQIIPIVGETEKISCSTSLAKWIMIVNGEQEAISHVNVLIKVIAD